MRVYVTVALAAFIALGVVLTVVMPPIDPTADPTAAWLVSLELPPLILFAFGAWLAARHAVAAGGALERWLALSLLVGVFTQLQAIRQPDVLGPLVTGTDLLRMASTVLLLVGATAQVRQMSRDRVRVMRMQRHELDERDAMVRELARYVAREETFRAVVHHELATPVATIRAYTHVLGRADVGDDRWRDALAGVVAETSRPHELIGRIDELRTLESADLSCTLRPVRALPLLQDVARYTRALLAASVVGATSALLPTRGATNSIPAARVLDAILEPDARLTALTVHASSNDVARRQGAAAVGALSSVVRDHTVDWIDRVHDEAADAILAEARLGYGLMALGMTRGAGTSAMSPTLPRVIARSPVPLVSRSRAVDTVEPEIRHIVVASTGTRTGRAAQDD
jgi:signal transduction histidine kinase